MVVSHEGRSRRGYPLGVTVVILIAVLRCVTIIAGLASIEGNPILDWLKSSSPLPSFAPGSDLEILGRIVVVGLFVASALVVVGLLGRRRWAWVLAIVTSGAILAVDLGYWWSGDPLYGSMLLNVIAVFYLNQRDVRLNLRGPVTA